MNEHVDEEIGALLDGRLGLRRRTELLTRLATDDADYEVFADTAAVLREAEEDGSAEKDSFAGPEIVRETEVVSLAPDDGGDAVSAGPGVEPREATEEGPAAQEATGSREAVHETEVTPFRPRRAMGWRSPAVRTLAAAAVLAAVAVPVLRSRMAGDRWRSPDHLASLGTPRGESMPEGWIDSIPWNRTRGAGRPAEDNGIAARLGVRSTQLVFAARADDRATTPLIANAIVHTLDDVRGSTLIADEYRQIAKSAAWSRPDVLKKVAEANEDVAGFVNRDYLGLGAWTEAARLATKRRDAAFFATRESRKALEQAVSLPGLNEEAKNAANHLHAAQGEETIQDWDAVRRDLDALQNGLAR